MSITSPIVIRSSILLLVIGFLALLGIVGMTIWLGERAQVYFEEVIEARDTRGAAVELRNAVKTAESSQRGYLVSGNEIYLAPYDTAKTLAQRQLDSLKRALAANPDTKVALSRLQTILAEKFKEMDDTVALKRNRRDAEALAIFQSNRGKALMDEANVFFAGVIRAADERLTVGVGEQRANAALLRLISIIGAVVIVIVVGGVTILAMRYTRELAEARDEVGNLNASLETRVADRTADLAQLNKEVQRFAYIVTHDLRAPLVNIMGFTSELQENMMSLQALVDRTITSGEPADPVTREAQEAVKVGMPEAIGFIRASTKKMDDQINAILKLSREGGRKLRPEPVDLQAVIIAAIATIQHQLSAANGEIVTRLDVSVLESDRLSIEQVLGNLFDNAVKYRSPARPLLIEVRTLELEDGRVVIEVSDNGRGIADQDLERIFDLFRRAGVQDQPGEGIGLAHVRTVVRNLGGNITVTSKLDAGTTFRITLPRSLRGAEKA